MRAWCPWVWVLGLSLACISDPPSSASDGRGTEADVGPLELSSLPPCGPDAPRPFTVQREHYLSPPLETRLAWGASPSDVWAVRAGDDSPLGLHHWDGARWTRYVTPEGFIPTTLAGSASDDVWFGGPGGRLFHWDGATLAPVDSATRSDIRTLHVVDAQHAWAQANDGDQGILLRWRDGAWRGVLTFKEVPESLQVTGPDEVWMRTRTRLWRFKEDTVTILHESTGDDSARPVWASGPRDVWAVLDSVLWHWNGQTLSPVSDAPPRIERIWGTGPGDVWFAVGGTHRLVHWDGGQLRRFETPGRDGPWLALQGTSARDIWAVNGSQLLHWDGQAWTVQQELSQPDGSATGGHFTLWRVGPDALWTYESRLRQLQLWNGQRRMPVGGTDTASTPLRDLHDVWAVSPTDVWVVGARGTAAHYDGTQWTLVPTDTEEDLHGVSGSGATDVWAVGDRGTVLHWEGRHWSRVVTGRSEHFRDVWSGADEVLIAGEGVALRRQPTGDWKPLPGSEWSLSAIWARGPEDIWALGAQGSVIHWREGVRVEASVPGVPLSGPQTALWGLRGTQGVIAPGRWRAEEGAWNTLSPYTPYGIETWRGAWQGPTGEVWLALSTSRPGPYDSERVAFTGGRCWSTEELLTSGYPDAVEHVYALHGAGANDVWAVGSRGKIFHLRR